jgi:uncharacterized membrane protein YfcA
MVIDVTYLAFYALLGIFAGILAGMLGVGGGLIIVPVLIWLFTLQGFEYEVISHAAIGTSLASIITTAISSAAAHHRHGAVNWQVVGQLAAGLFAGGLLGAWVASDLDTRILQLVFGIFAVSVGLQMFFKAKAVSQRLLPSWPVMNLVGAIIGTISGIVGIGGGSMTVPFLTWHNVTIRQAVATSSACGLPIAVAGFIGFMATGWGNASMPGYSWGYIYLPALISVALLSVLFAPVGAKLAHSVPVGLLKRFFSVLLMIVGIKLTGVF